MMARRIGVMAFVVTVAVCSMAWATESEVRSCVILDYGFGRVVGDGSTQAGDGVSYSQASFQVDKQSYAAPMGAFDFGFTYTLEGAPRGGTVPLNIVLTTPDGVDMKTTVERTIGGQDICFFRVSDPGATPRGKYAFYVFWQDRELASQVFILQ